MKVNGRKHVGESRMTEKVLEQFITDLEEPKRAIGSVLAKYHELGQSHWLGGDLGNGHFAVPKPRVREAFANLRDAQYAIDQAEHQLAMFSVNSGEPYCGCLAKEVLHEQGE